MKIEFTGDEVIAIVRSLARDIKRFEQKKKKAFDIEVKDIYERQIAIREKLLRQIETKANNKLDRVEIKKVS